MLGGHVKVTSSASVGDQSRLNCTVIPRTFALLHPLPTVSDRRKTNPGFRTHCYACMSRVPISPDAIVGRDALCDDAIVRILGVQRTPTKP